MKYYPTCTICIGKRMFASASTTLCSLLCCIPPAPREVHFWCLFPEEVEDATLFSSYKELLSPDEYRQVFQIHGKKHQKQALLTRVFVRTTLARYTDGQINPKSLKFNKNIFGKPEVIWPSNTSCGSKWKAPPLCFNLAHTSSLIACAVTTESLVGVDVEKKERRPTMDILALAQRFFSSQEILWLKEFTDPEMQRQQFIQLWTLKEAYVKALGRGIGGEPLKNFTIHLKHLPGMQENLEQYRDVHTITLEVSRNADAMATKWQFLLFELTNLHYASVCIEQKENNLNEGERNQTSSALQMRIWKTIPLVGDESLSGKEVVLGFSNPFRFKLF